MNMSEEEIEEELKKEVKNAVDYKLPDKRILIEHKGLKGSKNEDPEKEELKEKLEQRELQLGALALKEFEKQKDALLSKITDEKQRKYVDKTIGESPEMLESVKATMVLIGKGLEVGNASIEDEDLESVPPSGKVKLPPEDVKFASHTQVINGLYKILEDPTKTQAEKDEANRRINQFYDKLIKGRRKAIQSGQERYGIQYSQCPECGRLVVQPRDKEDLEECPYCGWKQLKKRR